MLADTAIIKRDAGIYSAVTHADRVEPDWSDLAYDALVDFARWARICMPDGFTAFDFRTLAPCHAPTTDKAFGAVFKRAARAGVIVKIGYRPHPERHCSPTPLWRAA